MIEETLTSTGTLHLKDRLFATLSGGEKQRVVIAAALAQIAGGGGTPSPRGSGDPGYLLLDEPTASLDLSYQLEVAALLRRLHEDRGVSIVISTHDLGLAGTLCDRLLMIRDGEVVADGNDRRSPHAGQRPRGLRRRGGNHPARLRSARRRTDSPDR